MTATTSKIAVVGIAGLVIGALVAAGIALAVDGDGMMGDDGNGSVTDIMNSDDDAIGMMGAMGAMDSREMMDRMRKMLGEDRFVVMMEHMMNHESMPMTGDESVDEMMHKMIDGMIDHMMEADPSGMPGQQRHGDHHENLQ